MPDSRRGPGIVWTIAAGALVGIVCFAFFLSYEHPWSLRAENLVDIYPAMVETYRQWMSGQMPVWTGGEWLGYPLLANPQSGAFYPVHLIQFWLTPAPHLRAFDLGTALHAGILFAGVLSLLTRLGCGRAAALFGAVLTLLAPRVLYSTLYLPCFVAVSWWPWLIAFADDLARRDVTRHEVGRSVLLGSLALAGQALSGYPESAFYAACTAGLWILLAESKISLGRRAARLALLGIAAALITAPQILPMIAELADTVRSGAPSIASQFSLRVDSVLDPFDPWLAGTNERSIALSPFIGFATLLLAFAGIALRRRSVLPLVVIVTFAALFALGRHTPFHGWIHSLPVFDRFRGPTKLFLVVQIFTAWLAAIGLQSCLERHRRGWGWIVAAGLLATLSLGEYAVQFVQRFPEVTDIHFHREPRLPRDADDLESVLHLLREGEVQPGVPARVLVAEYHTVFGNLGMIYGLEHVRGASNPMMSTRSGTLRRFNHNKAEKLGWLTRRYIDLYGIDRVVRVRPCEDPPWRDLEIISPEGSSLCVMRNPTARPRYELIGDYRLYSDLESSMQRILEPEAPSSIPVVASADQLPPGVPGSGSSGRVQVTSYRPGRVELTVKAERDTLLLVRETWKRGWRAEVDANAAEVFPAFGLFFAVPVPEGRHSVELSFVPPGLRVGLGLAGIWLALAAFHLWGARGEGGKDEGKDEGGLQGRPS